MSKALSILFMGFVLALGFGTTGHAQLPKPILSSLSPSSGPSGTLVTAFGSGFFITDKGHHSVVLFDAQPVQTTYLTNTSLEFVVPTVACGGDYTVEVLNDEPNSFGGKSAFKKFFVTCDFSAPRIFSFSPTEGAPGDVVQVFGENFADGADNLNATALFDGMALSTVVVSTTQVSFRVPQNAQCGPRVVEVINRGGSTSFKSASKLFNVTSCPTPGNPIPGIGIPNITSLSPSSGGPGTHVTVHGSGFLNLLDPQLGFLFSQVTFDDQPVPVTVQSGSALEFDVPAVDLLCGPYPVQVINPNPSNAFKPFVSNTVNFTISCGGGPSIPTPKITSLSPNSGGPGTTVTVHGSGFIGGGLSLTFSNVTFNGQAVPTTFVDANTLRFDVPGGNFICGDYPVLVENTSANVLSPPLSNTVNFTISCGGGGNPPGARPTPQILGLSPSSGAPNTQVMVNGNNFVQASSNILIVPGSEVLFDGAAVGTTFTSQQQLGFAVPTDATCGSHSVQVRTPSPVVNEPAQLSNTVAFAVAAPCAGGGGSSRNQPPTVRFSYSPQAPLVKQALQFTDQSTDPDGNDDIQSRVWEFGDSATSAAQHPAHTYLAAGAYTVRLSVTDKAGHTVTATQTVTVSDAGGGNPTPPNPPNPPPPQPPNPPNPPTPGALSIDQAVARLVPQDPNQANADQVIGDKEILLAVGFWVRGESVPNTGGQTISDAKIVDLVKKWIGATIIEQS